MRFIFALALTFVSLPSIAEQVCITKSSELSTKPSIEAFIKTMGGLDAIRGTWQLTGIPFVKDKLSFDFDSQAFYVQSDTDPRDAVSICIDDKEKDWLLILVGEPACTENKEIRIQPIETDRFRLRAYGTRVIGSAKFKKIAPSAMSPGTKRKPTRCKDGSKPKSPSDAKTP